MAKIFTLLEQARQLHRDGQTTSALHLLIELHQGDKENIDVLLELIRVTKNLKKWKEALEFAGKVFALKPGLAEVYLLSGELLFEIGSSDEAIAALSHYIQLRPTDPKGYEMMGNALLP